MKIGENESKNLYIALVHHPVYDKERRIISTSITNYDLHDLSRLARTYSLGGFYLITPHQKQIELMEKIKKHWIEGKGKILHPNRGEALKLSVFVHSIEEMIEDLETRYREKIITVGTTARENYKYVPPERIRKMLMEQKKVVIIFGTGYGLTDETLKSLDDIIEPIRGVGEFNHLSVRSAASIIIDRIFNC